jgi:hypothetical protein
MARHSSIGSDREAAMIYAIPMLIASASATFFCYLIVNSFSSLRNRACRVVCLSCPVLLAALLFAFPYALLNPLHEFLRGLQGFHYDPGNSLAIIVASLLAVITLLAANLVAQVRILNRRGSDSK